MAVKVESHIWWHAIETSVLAGAAAFAAALYAPGLGVPIWMLMLSEVVLGVVVAACSLISTDSIGMAFYLAAWTVFLVAWTCAADFFSVWLPDMIAGLILPMFILTPAGAVLFARHRAAAQKQQKQQKAIESNLERTSWNQLFDQVELAGVRVTDIVKTRGGRDIKLRLPATGRITKSTLDSAIDRIETARNLKHGSVRFSKGERGALAVMHLIEKDILGELIPFPKGFELRSINDAFPIGMYESGEMVMITFREQAALFIGQRGAGKSNLINVWIGMLAQCVDTVIFMIDLKGGRAARPWLEAWVDGETPRPVLDWVATTREEAEIMIDTLLVWQDLRSRFAGGREKVVPSPAEPAIILIIDEVSKVFGQGGPSLSSGQTTNAQLARRAEELVSVSRSEAIDPIFATQRGTVTKVGGGDLKSHFDLRVGLSSASASDIISIFPDDRSIVQRLTKLKGMLGVAMMAKGEDPAEAFKILRLDADTSQIRELSTDTGRIRPEPEQMLIDAAGTAYEERWSRPHGVALMDQVAKRKPMTDPDDEFEALTRDVDRKINPVRKRMRDLIIDGPSHGHSPFSLGQQLEKEGLEVTRETIQRWLAKDVFDGLFRKTGSGPMVRYRKLKPEMDLGRTGKDD